MARKIPPVLLLFILQSAAWGQESFNTTPLPIKSNFTCAGRIAGYYADLPSNCRVYHNCDDQGNKFSYYCPEMTAFRQEALICDHAHLVDCEAGTRIGKKTQNLGQSTRSTTRASDRWTTMKPFRDFLLNTNLTVRDGQKTAGSSFGFRFGGTSGLQSYQESGNPSEQNKTRFFGNTPERVVQSKEILLRAKTSDDQVTVNSRSRPAWLNHEDNFGGDRRAESTTSRFVFGPGFWTTKSYFDSKNSDFPRPDEAGRKSGQIPVPTSLKTPATTTSTPEIPLRDFTASLKPLVPNALEYDPYYPGESSATTESYYTPVEGNKLPLALKAPNFEPSIFGVYFKIPDVWPDFNTLDDIVDRRKLFYIPRSEKI